MAPPACEEFTAVSWWALIEWLSEQLHHRLGQLRRYRGAFAEAGPFLFHGRAPGLECVGWPHYHPFERPLAWVNVDVRLGQPARVDEYGRSVWLRKITIEARLPEAHQRKIVEDTEWWDAPRDAPVPEAPDEEIRVPHPVDRKRRAVRLAVGALRAQLRDYAQRRARVLLAAEHDGHIPDDAWREPLIPPRVWIDPKQTPLVTKMALLLILWHEGMARFDDSPAAWAWMKEWTGAIDDDQLAEKLFAMRRLYLDSEDWSGLSEKLVAMRGHRDAEDRRRLGMALATAGRQRARRGDALNYAMPLRDEAGAVEPEQEEYFAAGMETRRSSVS